MFLGLLHLMPLYEVIFRLCRWLYLSRSVVHTHSTREHFHKMQKHPDNKKLQKMRLLTSQPVFAPRGPTENKQSCHQGPIDFRTKKRTWKSDIVTKYEIRPKNAGFTFIRFPNNPPKTLCLGSWWSLWRWPCNAFGQGWSFWLICTHSLSCHVQLLVKPKHHFTH